jgi:hypothetical protein
METVTGLFYPAKRVENPLEHQPPRPVVGQAQQAEKGNDLAFRSAQVTDCLQRGCCQPS